MNNLTREEVNQLLKDILDEEDFNTTHVNLDKRLYIKLLGDWLRMDEIIQENNV